MINKLLVAIDGSSHSMKAVDYASAIAVACKARVIILNVIKVITVPKISVVPNCVNMPNWKMSPR